jgi:hypothetical protein
MKGNMPELGDLVKVNPAAIQEIEDAGYKLTQPLYERRNELALEVIKVDKEDNNKWCVYLRVYGTDRQIEVLARDNGTVYSVHASRKEPLFILVRGHTATRITESKDGNLYCACTTPRLKQGWTLTAPFMLCTECNKESR